MNKVFILKKLWVDSMENDISLAVGDNVVGFVNTESEAKEIQQKSGYYEGTGWPVPQGQKIAKICYEEVSEWEPI